LIQKLQIVFNNRELGSIFWIVLIVLLLLLKKSIRESILRVFFAFIKRKIITMILFSLIYSTSIVYILSQVYLWDPSMIKDSILWYILTAFAILFNLNNAGENKDYFKGIIRDNIRLVIVLEFIANIHSFNLWIEMILIPIIISLSILLAVVETKTEFKIIEKPIWTILTTFGLFLLILSIIDIIRSINQYANYTTLKTFLLPIILTVTFIPCAYLIALFMNYELLFVRIDILLNDKKLIRYARRRTLLKCGFNLRKVNRLTPLVIKEFHANIKKEDIKIVLN